MNILIETIIHTLIATARRFTVLALLPAAVNCHPAADDVQEQHAGPGHQVSAKLVEIVRNNTRQFMDVSAAIAAGYQPLFGCVSGPDHGAMGVHYINLSLVGDGDIDASRPEALIYEPSNRGLRLVGVEFIVDADLWMTRHNSPPLLEGQAFQFVNSPNRFGLAAFFELHVWAWRENPYGAFADWNTHVSCEAE